MTDTCSGLIGLVEKVSAPKAAILGRALTSPACKEAVMASNRICAIDACCKPIVARGWCAAHYRRWRVHGDPIGGAEPKKGHVQAWVESVALAHVGDECLIWPFVRSDRGYAHWTVDGRPQNASRVICRIVNGEPPTEDHVAAHECFNGASGCVNPRHLRWATQSENEQDKLLSGTSNRGSRHGLSKLTEDDVRAIRQLSRHTTQGELAKAFGISKWTVGDIIRRKRWGWLA
jgi:hypothetical protein